VHVVDQQHRGRRRTSDAHDQTARLAPRDPARADLARRTVANIALKTGRSAAEAEAALLASNPQGRLIHPDEVASAVLWLCAPGAEAITGQAIAIAGGEV